MFPTLAVVVVSLEEVGFSSIMTSAREDSAILAIEPERTFYAIEVWNRMGYCLRKVVKAKPEKKFHKQTTFSTTSKI